MAQRVLGVLLCLTVHETCHGLAAYALGDPTAKRMHRLSFNPLHHIDWLGLASMVMRLWLGQAGARGHALFQKAESGDGRHRSGGAGF